MGFENYSIRHIQYLGLRIDKKVIKDKQIITF